jgi:hypothetical protein
MTQQINGETGETTSANPAGKKTTEYEKVQMSDGREVSFPGTKTKLLKDVLVATVDDKGEAALVPIDSLTPAQAESAELSDLRLRMDFRGGQTRVYPINPALALRFAAHGMLQKYGDHLAGGVKNDDGSQSEDLEDWAMAVDGLHEQLQKGEWSKTREGGGGGVSVLVHALVAFTADAAQKGGGEALTIDQAKEMAKSWDAKTRAALASDPDIRPFVEKIRAERAPKVDTSALKANLLKGAAQAA